MLHHSEVLPALFPDVFSLSLVVFAPNILHHHGVLYYFPVSVFHFAAISVKFKVLLMSLGDAKQCHFVLGVFIVTLKFLYAF